MATDRDEQVRQQQELEEIRRSFAEMGARMGSLFEPAEPEEDDDRPEPSKAGPPALLPARTGGGKELAVPAVPAAPPAPAVPVVSTWPRWWLVGAVVLLLLAGTALGYVLPRRGGTGQDSAAPPRATTAATAPSSAPSLSTTGGFRTRTSVPEVCLETARLGDEVIARLNRNIRDERLFLALRDYTIASQACRKEASP